MRTSFSVLAHLLKTKARDVYQLEHAMNMNLVSTKKVSNTPVLGSIGANEDFLDTFKYFVRLLSEAVELGRLGDEARTRETIDTLRMVWSCLPFDFVKFMEETEPKNHQELSELIAIVNSQLPFVLSWTQRFESVIDNPNFRSSELGQQYIIDSRLPPRWNWERDIIVLYGRKKRSLAKLLIARGQKRVIITRGKLTQNTLRDYKKLLFGLSFNLARQVVILEAPESERQAEELKKIMSAVYDGLANSHINMNTLSHFAKEHTTQRIRNLKFAARAKLVEELRSKISGRNVVIVSPGPSLGKNIKLLGHENKNIIIFAIAQAIPALLKHNINPDYVLVRDSDDYSRVLDGFDCAKTSAIFADVTHERFCAKPFENMYFLFHDALTPLKIKKAFGTTEKQVGGMSISVTGFNLALHLGARNVALIGQDLSYGDQVYYGYEGYDQYVRGSDECLDAVENKFAQPAKTLELPGYYGGVVATKHDYWAFHTEFVDIAKSIKDEELDVKIFNCTEGGAFIEGFSHVSFSNFLTNLSAPPRMNKSEYNISSDAIHTRLTLIRKYLIDTKVKCKTTIKLTRDGIKLISGKFTALALQRNSEKLQRAVLDFKELSSMSMEYLPEIERRLGRNKLINNDFDISNHIYTTLNNDSKIIMEACNHALAHLPFTKEIKS